MKSPTKVTELTENSSLADHAEAWMRETGKEVPQRDTPKWESLYEEWIEFAFSEFKKPT